MSLILIEGLDRTGKTTVANYFKEELNYEIVHLSAPSKDTSSRDYFEMMAEILASASTKNIVMDRTHYGELVWPIVYNRTPLLSEEDIYALREIEDSVGVRRILMYDYDVEAHWERCVKNNEPLTKAQFARARSIYYGMAHKFGFEITTLPKFMSRVYGNSNNSTSEREEHKEEARPMEPQAKAAAAATGAEEGSSTAAVSAPLIEAARKSTVATVESRTPQLLKTPEQIKLEKANAINDILSKKIIKAKSPIYEEIENDIRTFLRQKLASLLGEPSDQQQLTLSPEEIKFYKLMYKRAIQKGDL